MGWSIAAVVVGLAVVVLAAEQLVKVTVGLARGIGASTFLIAVVFLGFDPENLAVGAVGSAQSAPGIAAATVIGSAMVAIALALGIAALVAPMRFEHMPRRILAVPVIMVVLIIALALDGRLSRLDGAMVVMAYLAALLWLGWLGRCGLNIQPAEETASSRTARPGQSRAPADRRAGCDRGSQWTAGHRNSRHPRRTRLVANHLRHDRARSRAQRRRVRPRGHPRPARPS
ncbi:hypothetical protein IU459_15820 [Nocardia amamiensis]|uniref:Sodium/calcium exchanger membrane region domain-containing protein n=1 Tax=Nocardia amamiensis TaxID=404578 RepID=A0ABS0CQY8_9NOCA|nr:hypothetical protein [Nocardia amamiensis]MBF6299001.1 hypothetical protein [Nocardia amamiensis]